MDTVKLACSLLPNLHNAKLDTVAKALNVSLENHHRAVDDAGCTAEIFVKFLDMLKGQGTEDLNGGTVFVSPLWIRSNGFVPTMPSFWRWNDTWADELPKSV